MYKVTNKEIDKELQLIDELKANFNPNNWIKAKHHHLLNKVK